MDFDEIRRIPICNIMARLGYAPVSKSQGGIQLLYYSPFREDRKPSFSVHTVRNIWNDFGTSMGGNVIDLAIAINGNCSFREAVQWLEKMSDQLWLEPPLNQDDHSKQIEVQPSLENISVESLKHNALLEYLFSRNIPAEIGKRYCKEVHYNVGDRRYFALCFKNILGGMEIRNAFFKGCHGEKAPSVIHLSRERRTPDCCVFEGFMDFLSYMTLKERGDSTLVREEPCDCIVMNTTALARKSIPFIRIYGRAFCYFDNDDAGRSAFERIRAVLGDKAFLMSGLYADFNDLNDALCVGNTAP